MAYTGRETEKLLGKKVTEIVITKARKDQSTENEKRELHRDSLFSFSIMFLLRRSSSSTLGPVHLEAKLATASSFLQLEFLHIIEREHIEHFARALSGRH